MKTSTFFSFEKKQTLNPAIIQIWNSIQIFQLHTKRDNKIPSQRDTSGIYEIQFGADLIYEQDKKLSYLCLNRRTETSQQYLNGKCFKRQEDWNASKSALWMRAQ